MKKKSVSLSACFLLVFAFIGTDAQRMTDSNTPLHLVAGDYITPYGIPDEDGILEVINRVYACLDTVTPARLVEPGSGTGIDDPAGILSAERTGFQRGDFRIVSYEWGVTYAGMLLAGKVTGEEKFTAYTLERLGFLAGIRPYYIELEKQRQGIRHPLRSVLHPRALDDAGAMCAAMIKARRTGFGGDLDPMIENYIDYISNQQFRLGDGTLARNRPQPNSLWLDDLFMSVPALAQMGKYTGDHRYFDDAVRQVLQFSDRMFNEDKGLFMHGWIQGMDEHPQFHWGRANGWAIMAMVELLDVLPEDHAGREEVLELLRRHVGGLARYQSPLGFWHQLIDRNDSYLETSATAIYTYAFARAINRGWVDARVYGPAACLAWNAVASKVNEKGQVEGTCVGTGMAFDPAFYYHRPVSAYAAHGYGPTLLAGAEMIEMIRNTFPKMNDSAIQFYDHKIETDAPIFSVEE
jgi:unsaturated rhamnogalacturonyl hydrolase